MLCFGEIDEIDSVERRVKIKIDGDGETAQITAWLPWPADIGNNYIRWRPLKKHTQVLLACPSGTLANGQIIGMLYSSEMQSSSTDSAVDLIEFGDGTTLQYNSATQHLGVNLASGTVHVEAADRITLTTAEVLMTGNVRVDGNIDVGGKIKAAGDISDGTRSMADDRSRSNKHQHAVSGHSVATPTSDW